MKKELKNKATGIAGKIVASWGLREDPNKNRLVYMVYIDDVEFSYSEAKKLIKVLDAHVRRIAAHKEKA